MNDDKGLQMYIIYTFAEMCWKTEAAYSKLCYCIAIIYIGSLSLHEYPVHVSFVIYPLRPRKSNLYSYTVNLN